MRILTPQQAHQKGERPALVENDSSRHRPRLYHSLSTPREGRAEFEKALHRYLKSFGFSGAVDAFFEVMVMSETRLAQERLTPYS